jgi:hypothetical protein
MSRLLAVCQPAEHCRTVVPYRLAKEEGVGAYKGMEDRRRLPLHQQCNGRLAQLHG